MPSTSADMHHIIMAPAGMHSVSNDWHRTTTVLCSGRASRCEPHDDRVPYLLVIGWQRWSVAIHQNGKLLKSSGQLQTWSLWSLQPKHQLPPDATRSLTKWCLPVSATRSATESTTGYCIVRLATNTTFIPADGDGNQQWGLHQGRVRHAQAHPSFGPLLKESGATASLGSNHQVQTEPRGSETPSPTTTTHSVGSG